MIFLLGALFGSAPPDSAILSAADSLLRLSDTIAAVERLQTHADTCRVSQSVSDLLDRLMLPDWPDAQRVPGENAVGIPASAALAAEDPARKPSWIVSGQMGRDEGDELPFWMGIQALRRSSWRVRGAAGHMEFGLSQVVASADPDRLANTEALSRIECRLGHWLGALNGWLGADQDFQGEIGFGGAISRLDTFSIGRVGIGPEWRVSLNRASWVGLSGRWEAPKGVSLLGAFRWREDPELRIEEGPLLYQRATSRIQGQGSLSWLGAFGVWRLGPLFELDWRSSTASDLWVDSTGVRNPSRQETTWSAGGIFSVTNTRSWSARLRPSWVFASSDPVFGEGARVVVEGLRLAIDGVLVL